MYFLIIQYDPSKLYSMADGTTRYFPDWEELTRYIRDNVSPDLVAGFNLEETPAYRNLISAYDEAENFLANEEHRPTTSPIRKSGKFREVKKLLTEFMDAVSEVLFYD